MKVPMTAGQVAGFTGGTLLRGSPDAEIAGVSIDSRDVPKGALFVAVVGPNHDAHDFLAAAAAAGAGGLLIARGRELPAGVPADLPVIAVDDTTRGLADLARGHRSGFDGTVIAITGSNGKTTTKDMCAAIMSVTAPCLKTAGNLNNQFGVPLTLLRRETTDRSAVIELGMNHRGEIALLCEIARPTVGLITNVGTAHIEHLGSREEIAREKGDLVAGLAPDAVAVLNADDARVAAQAARTRARVLLYGTGPDADVRAENPTRIHGRGWKLDLVAPSGRIAVEVAGLGETTWRNALAAAAGALAGGATLEHVAAGLARHRPVPGRLLRVELEQGASLIDDTYNANPQSMEAALRLLAELAVGGRGFAVLGDMGELGDTSPAAHRDTGRLAAELGIDTVIALGPHAEDVVAGALAGGLQPERARVGRDCESVASELAEVLGAGDWVLVKGSRAMRMERVVRRLAGAPRSEGEGS